MVYKVKMMPRAEADLRAIYAYIQASTLTTARNWYLGLKEALRTLKENPQRLPVTSEHPAVRHLLYGKKPHVYRVLFRMNEKQKLVEVLHIRHGARDSFTAESIP